ncbi:ROK family transcriptional regulator [Candidatus Omnitrophota bacterium]
MKKILFKERLTEKEKRNLDILESIRKAGKISRSDISKITSLNIVTVSNYVGEYIKKGLVLECGLDVSTGGRKPELVELNPKYGYTIGVDLGPVHIVEDAYMEAVLIDVTAKIIAKARVKKEAADFGNLDKVVSIVKDVIKKGSVDKNKLFKIGLGIGGVLDRYKGIVRVPVKGGETVDYFAIQDKLEDEFGVSSIIENDANSAALGEKWAGLGMKAGIENMICMCSDSGAGLIIKGELYPGSSSVAGELNVNSPVEGDKNKTCWSSYSLGCCLRSRGIDLGIASRAKAYCDEHKDYHKGSKMCELVKGDINKLTIQVAAEAAKAGDKLAKDLLEEAGDYLGTKVAFLINVFNPDIVIIGRGIERGGDLLLNAMRNAVGKWTFSEAMKTARVVITSLGEDSIAIGAAALAMQNVFIEVL